MNENVNERTIELYDYIKRGDSVDKDGLPAFKSPKLLHDTWVIHFTSNGDDLVDSGGFTFGCNDFTDLPSTDDGRDYPENQEKGFDFAFLLNRPAELYIRTHDEAFVFRASGVLCKHQGETVNGDRPMEQFIFWCDDTILKPYYRITHVKSRWNGMIYDEYTIRKNGNEYIETYNEYDMSTRYFKKFKDVYECIVEDIRQDGDDFNKRLTIQRDYE